MKTHYLFLLCLGMVLLVSSCSTKYPRGTIRENHAVTNIFRSAEINPDYNYFYYGIVLEPDTIMGIDKGYTVQSRFWSPVDLTTEQLQTWITTLDNAPQDTVFASSYMGRYQGAYVLDPNGDRVGMWYSKLDWGVFEFQPENIVVPYPPALKEIDRGRFMNRDD